MIARIIRCSTAHPECHRIWSSAPEVGMSAISITDHDASMPHMRDVERHLSTPNIRSDHRHRSLSLGARPRRDPTRAGTPTLGRIWIPRLHRRRNPDDVSGGGVIYPPDHVGKTTKASVSLMKPPPTQTLEGRVMRYPRMDKESSPQLNSKASSPKSTAAHPGIIQTRLRPGPVR